ncbi:hypothetical protein ACFE04_028760 [Oxalis oulophora]
MATETLNDNKEDSPPSPKAIGDKDLEVTKGDVEDNNEVVEEEEVFERYFAPSTPSLHVTDSEVQTMPWATILDKVVRLQSSEQLYVVKDLSAHDIIFGRNLLWYTAVFGTITAISRTATMVVVVDDEDREHEEDLILAAELATPEAMAFIVKHETGIVCVSMKEEDLERLNLQLMVNQKENEDKLRTAFTVTVVCLGERDKLVDLSAAAPIPTMWGPFKAYCYRLIIDGIEHIAMVKADVGDGQEILVRVHSECLTGDIFGSARCDCGYQLSLAVKQIEAAGRGVLVYLRGHKEVALAWDASFVLTTCKMMVVTLGSRCSNNETDDEQPSKVHRSQRLWLGSCRQSAAINLIHARSRKWTIKHCLTSSQHYAGMELLDFAFSRCQCCTTLLLAHYGRA